MNLDKLNRLLLYIIRITMNRSIKRFLFITILSTSAIQMNSQVLLSLVFGDKLNSESLRFGLEGGYNFSTIDGMQTNSMTSNLNLGFYFDFVVKSNRHWSFYTGTLVKSNFGVDKLRQGDLDQLGISVRPELGDYTQVLKSFMVPALMKYVFDDGVYIESGLQLNWIYDAFVEFNSTIDDIEIRERENNKDDINWFDFGPVVGAGYQFKNSNGLAIGAKYYLGLMEVYQDIDGYKNRSIFVKVNIPIGVKKAKKRREEKAKAQNE